MNTGEWLRVGVRTVAPMTTVRVQGSVHFDPQTESSVAYLEALYPLTIDIDVTAPDRKTILRYSLAVTIRPETH